MSKSIKEMSSNEERLKMEKNELKCTVKRLSEEVLDTQCRSMRDNVIFEGLKEPFMQEMHTSY